MRYKTSHKYTVDDFGLRAINRASEYRRKPTPKWVKATFSILSFGLMVQDQNVQHYKKMASEFWKDYEESTAKINAIDTELKEYSTLTEKEAYDLVNKFSDEEEAKIKGFHNIITDRKTRAHGIPQDSSDVECFGHPWRAAICKLYINKKDQLDTMARSSKSFALTLQFWSVWAETATIGDIVSGRLAKLSNALHEEMTRFFEGRKNWWFQRQLVEMSEPDPSVFMLDVGPLCSKYKHSILLNLECFHNLASITPNVVGYALSRDYANKVVRDKNSAHGMCLPK